MVPEAAAARSELERLRSQGAFSAAADRARSARFFILWLMPGVLFIVTVLTAIEWFTGTLPAALWLVTLAFWALQGAFILLVRRGADPVRIAGFELVICGVLEWAALYLSPDPIGASASLLFFVVAASYFLSTTTTILFTIATTAAITIASHTADAWDAAYFFPSTAFTVLITGLLCAFVMNRARGTERRLEELALEQRAALERLEQVDRARDRLIANVSHELRTPLTSTIGSIETMLREDVQLDDASRQRLMLLARDGGLRLLALVEDLLTLGATRPDSLELSSTPEQLASLARDAVVGIDPGAGRAVLIDVHDDPLVRVDRLRMLQVVGNLVVNAIRHGRGDVIVETRHGGGVATLRVIDDGDGVDPAHLDELFLPFARFSTRPDSTGLGLAICRTIVEAHGGTIEYSRNHTDARTCFTVTLPAPASPGPSAS